MVCGTCSDYVAKGRERQYSEAKPFLFLVREAHKSALRFVFHASGDAGAFRRDVAMARCHSFLLWRLVVFWLLASAACRCPSWRMPEMEMAAVRTVAVEMVVFETAAGGSIVTAAGVSMAAGTAAVGSATVETAAVGPVVPEMELVSC